MQGCWPSRPVLTLKIHGESLEAWECIWQSRAPPNQCEEWHATEIKVKRWATITAGKSITTKLAKHVPNLKGFELTATENQRDPNIRKPKATEMNAIDLLKSVLYCNSKLYEVEADFWTDDE